MNKGKVVKIILIILVSIIIITAIIMYLPEKFASGKYFIIENGEYGIKVGEYVTEQVLDSDNNIVETTYIQKYSIYLSKNNIILDSTGKKIKASDLKEGDNIYIIRKLQRFTESIWCEVIPLENVFFIKILSN